MTRTLIILLALTSPAYAWEGFGAPGSPGSSLSSGNDYGHTNDSCGNECGNTSVYVGPGPIGGSTSSRSYGGSYGLDGGAYENRR